LLQRGTGSRNQFHHRLLDVNPFISAAGSAGVKDRVCDEYGSGRGVAVLSELRVWAINIDYAKAAKIYAVSITRLDLAIASEKA
jgi:hypothetical protein